MHKVISAWGALVLAVGGSGCATNGNHDGMRGGAAVDQEIATGRAAGRVVESAPSRSRTRKVPDGDVGRQKSTGGVTQPPVANVGTPAGQGQIAVAYATSADALHTTYWKINNTSPRAVGVAPVTVYAGTYTISFTSPPTDRPPPNKVVTVGSGKLVLLKVYYK